MSDAPSGKGAKNQQENGLVVSYERIQPETLRKLIQEFVTRDGADWADPGCSLDEKVGQVMEHLKTGRVEVVFDLSSQTANIVPGR
jgi:uncharacterized protein